MANDVLINVGANTESFQVAIGNAYKKLNDFGIKNKDLATEIDRVYKSFASEAARMSDSVQGSFNALQVKSDKVMAGMREVSAKTSQSWLSDFGKIANSAETTSADVMRSFRKLNELESVLNASGLKDEFKTLGIQSAASIEAAKIKIKNAFEEIKVTGTKYPQDIVRAHEAMTAEIERLDKMLMTSAERAAAARTAAYKESASAERAIYAAMGMQGAGSAATLIGQPLAGSDFSGQLKRQMEEAVGKNAEITEFSRMRSREMASYAASAMQGEAAAARIVGQTQAGANFTSQLRSQMEGAVESTKRVEKGISGWSLASVAAIAKIQILYSLINQTMSLIGSMPRVAVDAIETFQSSMVKNAAVITSMSGNVKDIGKSYQENKKYAEAVQNVLVKMDAQTIASYKQLQLMNDAFVNQGIFIDINNKKQLDGYKNIANALATISAGMQNADLQFSQEIRGLINGEDKPTNMLFRQLKAIDPLLKEHLADWKKVAAETGNAGYVLEKLGPLLVGYAAASGDIDSLWTTVKSTMSTIRDEVLRGGLKSGFSEIVAQMKELAKYAEENKEKIQAFLRDGFANAKAAVKFIWDMREGFVLMGQAALFVAITTGITSVIEKLKLMDATFKAGALYKALSNPAIAGVVLAAYGGYKAVSQASENNTYKTNADTANSILNSTSGKMFGNGAKISASNMAAFQAAFPLDGPELLALAINKGAATLKADNLAGGSDVYKLMMNLEQIKKLREGINEVVIPKAPKGGTSEEEKTSIKSKLEEDKKRIAEFAKLTKEQYDQFFQWCQEIERTSDAEVRAFNLINSSADGLSLNTGSRYNATPLSKYRLSTSFYGIKQQAPAFKADNYDFDRAKEGFANAKSMQSSLGGDNYGSRFAEINSSFEIEKAMLQKQYDEKLMMEEDFNRRMVEAKQKYNAGTTGLAMNYASESLAIAKQAFADNKGVMLAVMIAEKAIAIARIMMNTEVAVSAAIASNAMLGPAGLVTGQTQAAAIRAMSYVSIGMVVASGVMEGMNIAGGRANGGPVVAGQTYLVNENRKSEGPEYFTPGVSGTITPASKMGGGVNINQYFNITGVGADIINNTKIIAKQAADAAKSEILNSMNRGGEFALASGRMR